MTDEALRQHKPEPVPADDTMSSISEEQIAHYLKSNPDFFLNWENVLINLKLPHSTGSAVSLVERQVSILRDRNIDLRNRFSKLIEAATDNDRLFNQTKKLTLALIEAGSLTAIIQQLQRSLQSDFDVDESALLLFDGTTQDIHQLTKNNFVKVVSSDETRKTLSSLLQGKQTICGTLREEEAAFIFGKNGSKIGSAAVLPLHYKGNFGLLAVGSHDKQHFKSNMGTLFINHIGEVVSRVIRPYITSFPA